MHFDLRKISEYGISMFKPFPSWRVTFLDRREQRHEITCTTSAYEFALLATSGMLVGGTVYRLHWHIPQ